MGDGHGPWLSWTHLLALGLCVVQYVPVVTLGVILCIMGNRQGSDFSLDV